MSHQKKVGAALKEISKKPLGQWIAEAFEEVADDVRRRKNGLAGKLTRYRVELPPKPSTYTPARVKAIRKTLDCSQSVFAQFLGVSLATVRAWEQGVNPPQAVACRLMDEVRHDPDYWRKRLKQLTTLKRVKLRSNAK